MYIGLGVILPDAERSLARISIRDATREETSQSVMTVMTGSGAGAWVWIGKKIEDKHSPESERASTSDIWSVALRELRRA
jgi:hypothetical protein